MRFILAFAIVALGTICRALPTPEPVPPLPQEIKNHIAGYVDANAQHHRQVAEGIPALFGGAQHLSASNAARVASHKQQSVHEHTTAQMLRKNAGPRRTRRSPVPPLPQEIKNHIAGYVDANAQHHRQVAEGIPALFGGAQHLSASNAARVASHKQQSVHEHTTAQMLRKNAGPRRTRRSPVPPLPQEIKNHIAGYVDANAQHHRQVSEGIPALFGGAQHLSASNAALANSHKQKAVHEHTTAQMLRKNAGPPRRTRRSPVPPLPQEIKNHIAGYVDANAQHHRQVAEGIPALFGGAQHLSANNAAQVTRHKQQSVHEHTTAQMLRKNAGPRRN